MDKCARLPLSPDGDAMAEVRRVNRARIVTAAGVAYHNAEPPPPQRIVPEWIMDAVNGYTCWGNEPLAIRAWKRQARIEAKRVADCEVSRFVAPSLATARRECELFDLFEREAASETLTEPERLTLSRLLVLADPRHGGPIRQQMAEAADLDISGLTAEQAACRIGAHRCGGE